MKTLLLSVTLAILFQVASFGQGAQAPSGAARGGRGVQIEGKEVFKNDDVVFRQLDEHTWIGSGHLMANESLYLVEGNDKAVLIDTGTKIADLDKVVASITKKPVMVVATHAHPDHTGSGLDSFPEMFINPGDAASQFMAHYKGKVNALKDGQILDLGGRSLEVVFTPAHTPGATTYIDRKAGYGFSGDSFGSGNLLLFGTFSTLLETCQKMSAIMDKYNIRFLYPGHYSGRNPETKQRVDDLATISRDALSGKIKPETNGRGGLGGNLVITAYGVRVNFSEASMK